MSHLWTVAGPVDGDGLGQLGAGVLEGLPCVGCHQLTQLACLAEGQRAQPMLDALGLQSQASAACICLHEGLLPVVSIAMTCNTASGWLQHNFGLLQ